jgi:hypothetical protein
MLGPAAPLLGGEGAVGVDLGLEAGQERRPGRRGRLLRMSTRGGPTLLA